MESKTNLNIGIVLLAAGQASRMGMPKQLLVHERVPLIRHLVTLLLGMELPVCVVLGARAKLVRPVIADLPIQIVINEDWKSGMAGSLKHGLEVFREKDGVLFCVVDQPYLSKEVLKLFIDRFQSAAEPTSLILTARYESGRLGVPALFGRQWYKQLSNLAPEFGARQLIRSEKDSVEIIDFPAGDFDLDRPEDWDKYRAK
jgi:CTP:molybdopterin cytidylyltransferase MocA